MRVDAEASRTALRRAARSEFSAHGFDVPLERIARVAGVSKGTIYNHFGGRSGLIAAVVEELVAKKIAAIEDDARAQPAAWPRLRTQLISTWTLQLSDPAANDVLTAEGVHSDVVSQMCANAATLLEASLLDAKATHEVRDDVTPDDLQRTLLIVGAGVRAGVFPDAAAFNRFCVMLLRGIRSESGEQQA